MREFKFRAHEKHSGWYSRRFTMENLGELINDENVTILQFTGLKDKNGVDIYEGDILKGGIYKEYEVKWDGENSGFGLSDYAITSFEVIGNIHQN